MLTHSSPHIAVALTNRKTGLDTSRLRVGHPLKRMPSDWFVVKRLQHFDQCKRILSGCHQTCSWAQNITTATVAAHTAASEASSARKGKSMERGMGQHKEEEKGRWEGRKDRGEKGGRGGNEKERSTPIITKS